MLSPEFFTHYPSRLLWAGSGSLFLLAILCGSFLLPVVDQPAFPLPPRKSDRIPASEAIPSILAESGSQWQGELPAIEDEMAISLSPPRPGLESLQPLAHVRLKTAQQSRQVSLPARLYLSFNDQGVLGFQDEPGPFFADLSLDGKVNIVANVFAHLSGGMVRHAFFSRQADLPPVQKAEEFQPESPLRILGEARWLGVDLVSQHAAHVVKQRLEIGSAAIDVAENEWIGWAEGKWSILNDLPKDPEQPIARIRSISLQAIEWDSWDPSHVRLAITQQPVSPAHIKTEEWINSLRIRSDKQISCIIEKQSFILRLNDWLLKENGRWRIIRKAEDRQQIADGYRAGDLFILEKIDNKQKNIRGKLFLVNRTQMVNIDATASNMKQDKKHLSPQTSRRLRKDKSA
jgi:hypothetical protein